MSISKITLIVPSIFIFVCLILALCNLNPIPPIQNNVDKRIAPYVDLFEAYGKAYIGKSFKIPVIYINIGRTRSWGLFKVTGAAVGLCFIRKGKPNYMLIDDTIWNELNVWGREQLIFHELGHCVLNRKHLDTIDDSKYGRKRPFSIMFSYIIPQKIYKQYHDVYIKELFLNINDTTLLK